MKRKASEEDLFLRLNALIETAIDGIITIDSRGTIESINPAGSKLFGYEPQETIGTECKGFNARAGSF